MYVTNASGRKEEFDSEKVKQTCLRAGASEELAEKVVGEVESRAYDGIPTKDILEIILQLLEEEPGAEMRYDLKKGIMDFGPTGFPFENFVSEILEEHGYETEVGKTLKGKCVPQEVDIVAERDGKSYLVECKFHNSAGLYTGLKVAMYTYARFLDLKDRFQHPWLITNTKCSTDAKRYAECVDERVTSWNYPEDSLRKMIESKKLYPVTVLKSVDSSLLKKLFKSNLTLAKNITEHELEDLKKMTKIPEETLRQMREEAVKVIQV